MKIALSFFDLLIIIGMVTGIICSILLFNKSDKKPSNKFLGLGILAFVWLNTKILLVSLNLWEIHGLGFFPNGIELALPPLFYFYFVSLIQPQFQFRNKDWLHFIPFFISQTYAIVVYVAVMQTHVLAEKELIAYSFCFDEMKHLEDYLNVLSTLIYLSVVYTHIRRYQHWLSQNTSDTQYAELGFLKNLMIGFLFLIAYNLVNLILNYSIGPGYHWRWEVSHLMVASLVYYMGLVGYKNSDLIPPDFSIKPAKKTTQTDEILDVQMIEKLNRAIDTEKVHLNPKLSLQELASLLEVKESSLSSTIKAHYKKNFRSFINEARVEEVKKRLEQEGVGNLSLLGIAQECGFNSEASFYRIFKATTGSTPKQFLSSFAQGRL